MEKLVACSQKRPDALCRLICFPWAGAGTSQLSQWSRLFNDSIEGTTSKKVTKEMVEDQLLMRMNKVRAQHVLSEMVSAKSIEDANFSVLVSMVLVYCIRLPGRETRLEEPFAKDMTSIVNEITTVLLQEFKEKPFAFFGHSLGTYVSFATALHLRKKYGLEPVHLFMSAAHAPNSAGCLALKSAYVPDDDDSLLANLKTLGGIFDLPKNEELRRELAFTFRQDARVFQTFSFDKAEMNTPFSCDVTYFCGSDDTVYDVQGWQELTTGDTSFYELPGDHFYLLQPSNESFLTKHITRCIENADL